MLLCKMLLCTKRLPVYNPQSDVLANSLPQIKQKPSSPKSNFDPQSLSNRRASNPNGLLCSELLPWAQPWTLFLASSDKSESGLLALLVPQHFSVTVTRLGSTD